MNENDLPDLIKKITAVEKAIGSNLHNFRYMLEDANSIWKRCPFQVNDRVQLTRTPEITKEKAWGWWGSRHFLIKGATGRISERQFYDGLFCFYVVFDNETWIDHEGKAHSPDRPALYSFNENWLTSANYQQLTCEAL